MPRTTKSTKSSTTRTMRSSSTRPRPVTRAMAEKYLANVPEERVFWVHDGPALHNMLELKEQLNNMSDQNYYYHANEIKKDFSCWVRDVIGDEKLAKELDSAANREQAAKIVEDRYKLLTEKMNK